MCNKSVPSENILHYYDINIPNIMITNIKLYNDDALQKLIECNYSIHRIERLR